MCEQSNLLRAYISVYKIIYNVLICRFTQLFITYFYFCLHNYLLCTIIPGDIIIYYVLKVLLTVLFITYLYFY